MYENESKLYTPENHCIHFSEVIEHTFHCPRPCSHSLCHCLILYCSLFLSIHKIVLSINLYIYCLLPSPIRRISFQSSIWSFMFIATFPTSRTVYVIYFIFLSRLHTLMGLEFITLRSRVGRSTLTEPPRCPSSSVF